MYKRLYQNKNDIKIVKGQKKIKFEIKFWRKL